MNMYNSILDISTADFTGTSNTMSRSKLTLHNFLFKNEDVQLLSFPVYLTRIPCNDPTYLQLWGIFKIPLMDIV